MLRSFYSLIVMLLLLVIGIGLGAFSITGGSPRAGDTADGPQASDTPPPTQPVGPAADGSTQAAKQQVIDQYVGVTFARQSVDIVARSEGRLEAIDASLGDHLKPGDVIARIESSSVAQQLEMTVAALRSARAEERNAEIELKEAEDRASRREALVEAGVLSKEELATARVQVERAGTNLEVKQARVAEQTARVEQVKESLAHTVITAAFEGTVAARYLDPGATVHSGTPVINLMRSEDLWVRFAVSGEQRATIRIGSTLGLRLTGLNVMIPGVIEHIAPGVDAVSQEVVIEAKLKVPASLKGQIKPGLSGHVLTTGRQAAVPCGGDQQC